MPLHDGNRRLNLAELLIFALSLAAPVVLLVAFAWHCQWKRDPEAFRNGFRGLSQLRAGQRIR